jgi:alpha-glucosidase/alpha-D-xyloside xylohydrolase
MFRSAFLLATALCAFLAAAQSSAAPITAAGQPAELAIRQAGEHGVRLTLQPLSFAQEFPYTPALAERDYGRVPVRLREIERPLTAKIGALNVEVRPNPLTVVVTSLDGRPVQEVSFQDDGSLTFKTSDQPILGLGEGGPQPAPRGNWRAHPVQYDRNGAFHQMIPRWESNAYGSRNPVSLLIGTEGWALFVATPWTNGIDLSTKGQGVFRPWQPPQRPAEDSITNEPAEVQGRRGQRRGNRGNAAQEWERATQGRPPIDSIVPGAYDLFLFDAHEPAHLMKDLSTIAGPAVLPPKWALGYMQSHRELRDANMTSEELILWVIDQFRERKMPLDAVIYLGTGFTPTGWNTQQPSHTFNPRVFQREPRVVLDEIEAKHAKVAVHIHPWHADRLPTLHGNIPPKRGETLDASHIQNYWNEHVPLVEAGVDAWWPDEGDRFNLFERIKRHQMYYRGPLSTQPNVRPWSLHRNGHLGIAQWGGWVWSGDTQAAWKTLEAQIAVGLNHSLSISPYWGSDTGGFFLGVDPPELTGELYARWFQFSSFNPSFRSHGRIWRLRVPWGWGLSEMGSTEGERFPPDRSEMNNQTIEPICRTYANLRYQLIPYTYTLAAEARETGLPLMRSLWLHYPQDEKSRGLGDQFLWGRDLLVAPVYRKGATTRDVYLPPGEWVDWWTNAKQVGGQTVTRDVDLSIMPIYARTGAIIPFDPVRQYMEQEVTEPTTIRVYAGANGNYRWYEDDGKSQEYLNGRFAWTHLHWDDAAKRLTLERDAKAGTLPARPRKLIVELLPAGIKKELDYDGHQGNVTFE